MLIHKICKELLIFLLLLLPLLAEAQFSCLRFLYTAQVSFTLVCSFNGRLNGRLIGRLCDRLCDRLCGRIDFSYFDSYTRLRKEEKLWLISGAEWRAAYR